MRSLKTMLRKCTWGRSERRRAKDTRTPVATSTSVDVLESRVVLTGTPTVIDTPMVTNTPSTTDTPSAIAMNLDNDRAASAKMEVRVVITDQMVTEFWKTDTLTATRTVSPANTGAVDSAMEGTTAEGAGITVNGFDDKVPADDRAITADSESMAAPILLPVIRTGSGEQALVVRKDVSASASKHVDFLWAPRRVLDQARQTSIVVEMAPINDTMDEDNKDLLFGRLGDPSISIGTATVLGD